MNHRENYATKKTFPSGLVQTSLSPKMPSETTSICDDTRPKCVIVNPDVDFEGAFLPGNFPFVSQSSLPHTSTQLTMETTTSDQASKPPSEKANHKILVDAQVLSPDFDTPSSPQELEELLNYYSLPDSPELLVVGFKPMFSPISEESLSQLSSPFPHSDRRDSQPMGTRSQSMLLSHIRFAVILIVFISLGFYSIAYERSTCRSVAPDFISRLGRSSTHLVIRGRVIFSLIFHR
jgi:hypothetical protein